MSQIDFSYQESLRIDISQVISYGFAYGILGYVGVIFFLIQSNLVLANNKGPSNIFVISDIRYIQERRKIIICMFGKEINFEHFQFYNPLKKIV